VLFVRGSKKLIYFKKGCMPSMGQIMPHNITIGRKEPIATYVALLSLSQKQAITNPEN